MRRPTLEELRLAIVEGNRQGLDTSRWEQRLREWRGEAALKRDEAPPKPSGAAQSSPQRMAAPDPAVGGLRITGGLLNDPRSDVAARDLVTARLLLIELCRRGIGVKAHGEKLLVRSGPDLPPRVREQLQKHKAEIVAILQAEASYVKLGRRIYSLVDTAAACYLYGDFERHDELLAESKGLVEGPYHEARRRYMELVGPELIDYQVAEANRWARENG